MADRGRFEAPIRDESPLDAEGGRGIPLMLALVDEVEFASAGDGNRVRLRQVSVYKGVRAPTYVEAYQDSERLEIFTTSPVCGAWMNCPPPM